MQSAQRCARSLATNEKEQAAGGESRESKGRWFRDRQDERPFQAVELIVVGADDLVARDAIVLVTEPGIAAGEAAIYEAAEADR